MRKSRLSKAKQDRLMEHFVAGKMPVFGILKRGGKVYAKVTPNAKGRTLKSIMDEKIVPDSIVYSDTFSA